METQRCGHCREEKPLTEFVPSYRGRPGTWCRECHRAGNRERYVPRPRPEKETHTGLEHLRHANVKPETLPGGHAYCYTCGQVKPLARFYLKQGKPRQPCKDCYREWHRGRYQPKDDATDDPRECAVCGETYQPRGRRPSVYCSRACSQQARVTSGRWRARYIERKYGITVEEYDRMLAVQGGGCAICGRDANSQMRSQAFLHVDHDHRTGKVRGILCERCNQSIGQFEDNPVLLRRAAEYLERAAVS